MSSITFQGKDYTCNKDETVLECLERHGVLLPSGCRGGACQTCLTRALEGTPPPASQTGLKDTLKAQNYFLACICKPTEDMVIGQAVESPLYSTTVLAKDVMTSQVVRIRLSRPDDFDYRAGQFINLHRASDAVTRSYSLASLPSEDFLELHIKRVPDGRMSTWLFDAVGVGDKLEFFGPAGDCFYLAEDPKRPMLLAGTGTGLAPLYGILRDALGSGHEGMIDLFHGSLTREGLYLLDELQALVEAHANFRFHPCALRGEPPRGGVCGDITRLPFQTLPSLAGYRVYLCGDPVVVNKLKQNCFLSGAALQDIHSDPFVLAPAPA